MSDLIYDLGIWDFEIAEPVTAKKITASPHPEISFSLIYHLSCHNISYHRRQGDAHTT